MKIDKTQELRQDAFSIMRQNKNTKKYKKARKFKKTTQLTNYKVSMISKIVTPNAPFAETT